MPRPHPRFELGSAQEEVLHGALLGDGCIADRSERGTQKRNARFQYGVMHRDHAEFVKTELGVLAPFSVKRRVQHTDWGRNELYRFETIANVTLTDMRAKWYPGGVKQVPLDLEITPTVAHIWYLGDGSMKHGESCAPRISLATHGFDEVSVCRLKHKLIQAGFSEVAYYPDTHGFRIYVNHAAAGWLEFIGECKVFSLSYKWDLGKQPSRMYRKLACEEVRLIRRLRRTGCTQQEIAEAVGRSQCTVSRVLRGVCHARVD